MFTMLAFSQATEPASNNGIESQAVDQESSFLIENTASANNIDQNIDDTGGESVVWLFVRMIFALVVVVLIIYGIVFVLKKGFVPKESENPFLKKAATLTLAPGKTVQVITMPDKAWVVGVSDSGINLIGEITDADLVNQMILEAEKEPLSKPRDFASMLNTFSSTFANSAKLTEATLKKQRERLRRGGQDE